MVKRAFLRNFILLVALTFEKEAVAQADLPIKWHFTAVPLGDAEARLIFTANLDEGWHLYSQSLKQNGPLPTTFTFVPDKQYALKGNVKEESIPFEGYDPVFMMDIVWYKNTVVFSQDVRLLAPAATVRGKIEFMGCINNVCLPPNEVKFIMEVKGMKRDINTEDSNSRHHRYSGPGSSYNGLLLQQKTGNSSIVKKV
jgi:hypothetical protein